MNKMTWRKEMSPCLTRSRYRGHWITTEQRRMSIQEMMRLQGIRENQIKNDNSEAEFGKQIGNSMSLNVVERILFAIFSTIGMLPESIYDRWKI